MENNTLKKAALFVDYENANNIDSYNPIINKLHALGYNAYIRKIITSKLPKKATFENIIKENELDLVISNKPIKKGSSQVIKKKNLNNADFRVYIEVLKVLYNSNINTFIIYSSDDDFTELVCAIKREGKEILGIGSKETTSQNYASLFTKFFYTEDLLNASKQEKNNINEKKDVKNVLKSDIDNLKPDIKKKKKKNKEEIKKVEEKPKKKELNVSNEIKKEFKKDTIFYEVLKESTNEVLSSLKDKDNLLIANLVATLKDHYPFFKEYKKISPNDFLKAGFEVYNQDNKKEKCFVKVAFQKVK